MNHSVSAFTAGLLNRDPKDTSSHRTLPTSSDFQKTTIKIAKLTLKCLSLLDTAPVNAFFKHKE